MASVIHGGGRPPDTGPALTFQPTKALTFNVLTTDDASSINVIDAIAAVVGLPQVYMVRHFGGARFQGIVYTSAAMEKLFSHGDLSICGQKATVESLSPRVTRVACMHLPGYVPDDYLVRALTPHGKVVKLERPTTIDRPTVCNGLRVAWVEMLPDKPVPNFLRIQEHRVTCDYPGLVRVCSRCKQPGHLRNACEVPYCPRCSKHGHSADDCATRCRRCGGEHATSDCIRKKTFAKALVPEPQHPDTSVQTTSVNLQSPAPQPGTLAPEQLSTTPTQTSGPAQAPTPLETPTADLIAETSETSETAETDTTGQSETQDQSSPDGWPEGFSGEASDCSTPPLMVDETIADKVDTSETETSDMETQDPDRQGGTQLRGSSPSTSETERAAEQFRKIHRRDSQRTRAQKKSAVKLVRLAKKS